MIQIEVQYFDGCPHSDQMIKHIREAIKKIARKVDYKETRFDDPETARLSKFRGSPTVLINGHDLEDLPEPAEGVFACRYYKDGLPSAEVIMNKLKNAENLQ